MQYERSSALLLITLLVFSGCANNKANQNSKMLDAVTSKLMAAPVSTHMSQSASLGVCDSAAAQALLDKEILPVVTHAKEMWIDCQKLYSCSPTTTQFLKNAFQTGGTFDFGFANLKKLNPTRLGDKIDGLYVSKTERVFLDVSLNTPREACGVLLHEVAHRFDASAYGGAQSLGTEFHAYWYQQAFGDELVQDEGPLGDDIRAHLIGQSPYYPGWTTSGPSTASGASAASGSSSGPGAPSAPWIPTVPVNLIPYHTRESLLRAVSDLYGFPLDPQVIEHYQKLPREP